MKKDRTLLRDERKMEKLKAKLHTDDDCEFGKEVPFRPGLSYNPGSTYTFAFSPINVLVCVTKRQRLLRGGRRG